MNYEDRFVVEEDMISLEQDLSNFSLEDKKILERYNVMSIDIGIYHLGISVSIVDKDFNISEVVWIDLIDITTFTCPKSCTLHHDKTIADWVSHFFENYKQFFSLSDYILIERQPPMGLTAIEQLIFYQFRDKAVLISPNSVHKFFSLPESEYELRKEYSVKIGKNYLSSQLIEQLSFYDRQHDITDSILFTLYWCSLQRERLQVSYLKEKRSRALEEFLHTKDMNEKQFFDYFRYIPEN